MQHLQHVGRFLLRAGGCSKWCLHVGVVHVTPVPDDQFPTKNAQQQGFVGRKLMTVWRASPRTLNIAVWPLAPLLLKAEEVDSLRQIVTLKAPFGVGEIRTYTVNELLDLMQETMLEEAVNGIGLAGPQIGASLRLVVARPFEPDKMIQMINPRLEIKKEFGVEREEEGCLSIPGLNKPAQACKVERAKSVVVHYLDQDWNPRTVEAAGKPARVFQHELDHLDGKTIIERTGPVDRIRMRQAAQASSEKRVPRRARPIRGSSRVR